MALAPDQHSPLSQCLVLAVVGSSACESACLWLRWSPLCLRLCLDGSVIFQCSSLFNFQSFVAISKAVLAYLLLSLYLYDCVPFTSILSYYLQGNKWVVCSALFTGTLLPCPSPKHLMCIHSSGQASSASRVLSRPSRPSHQLLNVLNTFLLVPQFGHQNRFQR